MIKINEDRLSEWPTTASTESPYIDYIIQQLKTSPQLVPTVMVYKTSRIANGDVFLQKLLLPL